MNWIFAVGLWVNVWLNLLISHNHYVATGAYPTLYFVIDIIAVGLAVTWTFVAFFAADDN